MHLCVVPANQTATSGSWLREFTHRSMSRLWCRRYSVISPHWNNNQGYFPSVELEISCRMKNSSGDSDVVIGTLKNSLVRCWSLFMCVRIG